MNQRRLSLSMPMVLVLLALELGEARIEQALSFEVLPFLAEQHAEVQLRPGHSNGVFELPIQFDRLGVGRARAGEIAGIG